MDEDGEDGMGLWWWAGWIGGIAWFGGGGERRQEGVGREAGLWRREGVNDVCGCGEPRCVVSQEHVLVDPPWVRRVTIAPQFDTKG